MDLFSTRVPPGLDRAFTTARRTALDASSWVELVPGWLRGGEALLEILLEAVPWQQHQRRLFEQTFLEPRLTAQYKSLSDAPQALADAAGALSDHYGIKYDNLWLNLYRHGRDSTSWHRDRFSCRRPECIVPVLTIGAARRFLLKPRAGGSSSGFEPHCGDLVVMGGRCQEDWVHSVPKDDPAIGVRVSVNFQSSEQAKR
ncbi:MAG TPA: alpha-ketoglutarate-dependent dioxygenase AlkB [Steroidobacteraceae bacterium]|nr:alpha-ketoglutarate-dependent dioxygenase AlkB [Steroidobacteraceae bacterium]